MSGFQSHDPMRHQKRLLWLEEPRRPQVPHWIRRLLYTPLFTHFAMYQSLSLCMTTTALRNVYLHTFCCRMLCCSCECRLTMLTDVEKSCTSGRVWCELPVLPHWDSPPLLCVHTDSLTQIPLSDATHFVTCGRATKSYKESRLRSINASAPAAEAHFFFIYFFSSEIRGQTWDGAAASAPKRMEINPSSRRSAQQLHQTMSVMTFPTNAASQK